MIVRCVDCGKSIEKDTGVPCGRNLSSRRCESCVTKIKAHMAEKPTDVVFASPGHAPILRKHAAAAQERKTRSRYASGKAYEHYFKKFD